MDPVNGFGAIVRLLRQRLASQPTAAQKASTAPAGSERTAARAGARPSAEEIKHRIGERIRMLPESERQGPRAAKIFVETVITWEFGADLLRDAQLSGVTADVVSTLSEDSAVWQQLQSLLGTLQEDSRR